MENVKKILAVVMVVGMGGMFVLHTTNPEVTPKELFEEGYDLLYPSMGKKADYQKGLQMLEGVAAQQDDPLSAAHAKLELAKVYRDGVGVEQDEQKGRTYFDEALSAYEGLTANPERNLKSAAFASYELGHIYEPTGYENAGSEYGDWIEPDEERSRAYFEQARDLLEQVVEQHADLESVAKANLKLGHLYSAGHLGDPDDATARRYYERVAHNRQLPIDLSIDALFDLAATYRPEDIARAMNYYNRIIRLAQQAGKSERVYEARIAIGDAYAYGVNSDFAKAYEEYQKIAELPDAQLAIAHLYRYGQADAFPQDINRAEQYYKGVIANENASEEQKRQAQEDLGIMYSEVASNYYYGSGMAVNYPLAREYLNKALETVELPWIRELTYYTLGKMSYAGEGGARDYAAARDYFNQVITLSKDSEYSAQRTEAELYLGRIYYYGQEGIIDPDFTQAFNWFTRVIEDKNAGLGDKGAAKAYIGRMYYKGQGVARSYTQAGMSSQNALGSAILPRKERAMANYTLGMMYYKGHGVHRDFTIAREYLDSVVSNNDADPVEIVSAQEMIEQIDNHNHPAIERIRHRPSEQ